MAKRKGYSKRSDIPAELLHDLNTGRIETATLAEGLAIDFAELFRSIHPKLSPDAAASLSPGIGIASRMRAAGELAFRRLSKSALAKLQYHPSDTVRGWAAFSTACGERPALQELLDRIRPFADDPHFGVREWAWLAVRPNLAGEIELALRLLDPWCGSESENLRRFAVESTRPRGVWCAHIGRLKTHPELGAALLEPLRADPSRYVQNSVANWLSDASKTRPEWVRALVERWRSESPVAATQFIANRALRIVGDR